MMSTALKMKIKMCQYKNRLKRWKNYFNKLLNESNTKDWSVLGKPIGDRNFRVI